MNKQLLHDSFEFWLSVLEIKDKFSTCSVMGHLDEFYFNKQKMSTLAKELKALYKALLTNRALQYPIA